MKKDVRYRLIITKKVESIKGEVVRLRSAWTSVEHQMERECLHGLLWEHCSSTSHWSCTSPFQSWTTTTIPSVITNDNFCSRSIALLIVHRLHIFQWHQITTSFCAWCISLLWSYPNCELNSSSAAQDVKKKNRKKTMIRHWTSMLQSSLCRDLFVDLPVGNARGDAVFSYATKFCLISFSTETLE
jgi:hypothetical protein